MTDLVDVLREGAASIDSNGTPAQVGPCAAELRQAADEIERLRALQSQPLGEPVGWRLVPDEPTEAMTIEACAIPGVSLETGRRMWAAFLRKAPTPPAARLGDDAVERLRQIVRDQPLYPDTHAGTRQQWVKDEILRKLDEFVAGRSLPTQDEASPLPPDQSKDRGNANG